MRRAPLSRQQPRQGQSKPRKAGLPKLGRKGREWAATRARLKVQFEAAGIMRCEICGGRFALGFAHRKKRRNVTTQAELEIVALLCNADHTALEMLPEAEMGERIDAIIASRPVAI